MASADRQPTTAVERQLLEDASLWPFSRVLGALTAIVKAQGGDPEQLIRIRPKLSLHQQRSEVVSVRHQDGGYYEIEVNFLGLYGSSSPLPTFYTEELLQLEQEDQVSARLFLDVIHQRLYQLFAASQQKYDSLRAAVEWHQNQFSQLLHALIGTRDSELQQQLPDESLLLKYFGLLALPQRSAQGLESLLADLLSGVQVQVEQCVARKVKVPARHLSSLGRASCTLGNNALVGDQLTDRKSKIRIHIGPIDADTFHHMVADEARWRQLTGFIRFYLNTPMEVELRVILNPQGAQKMELGRPRGSQLGVDTWLNKPVSDDNDVLVSTLHVG